MVSFTEVPQYIWAFALIGILGGVAVLVNAEFQDTLSTDAQKDVTRNATLGISNITKQLPTVGTIVGVSLIVAVVVTLFFYFRGGAGGRGGF